MALTGFSKWQQLFLAYDPNFNTRTITHGMKYAFWAEIMQDGTFGEPKPLVGSRSFELTPEETNVSIFADDQVHYSTFVSSSATGSMVVYNEVAQDFRAWALGYEQDLTKTEGFFDVGNRKNFVLGFVETIDGNNLQSQDYKLTIYYNVACGKPSTIAATDEGELTPKDISFQLSASQSNAPTVTINGKSPMMGEFIYSQNPDVFDLFMDEVIVPGMTIPAPVAP
jgi:hypothetical protein